MGNKDIVLKQYLSDNRRFAEVFNNALFKGKCVIDPEKLRAADSAQDGIVAPGKAALETIQRSRDVAKIYNDQLELILLGIENQDAVHFGMPMRVMLYDALSYDKQYKEIRKTHKRQKDLEGAERLSGFARGDKLIPVITLVIYYGTDPWDGPKSLCDMLALPEGMSDCQSAIGDYPMHLLEVQSIQDLEAYDEDLMALFAFVKYQKNLRNLEAFIAKHEKTFSQIPRETYFAIETVADVKEISQYVKKEKEMEMMNMCDALKQLKEESMQQGRQEGIQRGRQEGVQRVQNIAIKLLKRNHPIPDIQEITDLSRDEIEALKAQLKM